MDTQEFKNIIIHDDIITSARALYDEGRERWQCGDRVGAITAYEESARLDPNGPGAVALEMTRDIMDFYDKQQFNP